MVIYGKETAMAMPKTALEGIRVLDLGRYQARPCIAVLGRPRRLLKTALQKEAIP
jgi:hypothetical protein